jgi:site-specific recombinase XerD
VDAVMARELWDHIKPFGSDERIIACCRRSVQYHIGKFHADIKYEYPKTDKTPEIKKKHAFYPHLLRHFRLTHLVTVYGMDGNYLKRFAGWGDVKMASHYVSFGTEDMAKKFM